MFENIQNYTVHTVREFAKSVPPFKYTRRSKFYCLNLSTQTFVYCKLGLHQRITIKRPVSDIQVKKKMVGPKSIIQHFTNNHFLVLRSPLPPPPRFLEIPEVAVNDLR